MMDLPAGYTFAPSAFHPPIGHPRLDIYLSDQVLNRSFDTRSVRFLALLHDDIRELVVRHPWYLTELELPVRICPGRFKLVEQDGDIHYGLSLGGELNIVSEGAFTHCTLTSAAPIFNLRDEPSSPSAMIATEVEVILAEREAAWGLDRAGFTERLMRVDPFTLFVAMIRRFEEHQEHMPVALRNEAYWDTEHTLFEILETLRQSNSLPLFQPPLEEIL